jgi:acetolactate synthase regulatory subunit
MSTSEQRENARLAAAELANVELLMETTRPVTLVVPQTEDEETEEDDP